MFRKVKFKAVSPLYMTWIARKVRFKAVSPLYMTWIAWKGRFKAVSPLYMTRIARKVRFKAVSPLYMTWIAQKVKFKAVSPLYMTWIAQKELILPKGMGNYVFFAPKYNIVIATTSSFSSMQQLQVMLDLIYEQIIGQTYKFGYDRLISSSDLFIKDLALHKQEVVTQASWQDSSLLVLTLVNIETPFAVKYSISFKDKRVELQCTSNAFEEYKLTGILISS
jgi:hypothetical protein